MTNENLLISVSCQDFEKVAAYALRKNKKIIEEHSWQCKFHIHSCSRCIEVWNLAFKQKSKFCSKRRSIPAYVIAKNLMIEGKCRDEYEKLSNPPFSDSEIRDMDKHLNECEACFNWCTIIKNGWRKELASTDGKNQ